MISPGGHQRRVGKQDCGLQKAPLFKTKERGSWEWGGDSLGGRIKEGPVETKTFRPRVRTDRGRFKTSMERLEGEKGLKAKRKVANSAKKGGRCLAWADSVCFSQHEKVRSNRKAISSRGQQEASRGKKKAVPQLEKKRKLIYRGTPSKRTTMQTYCQGHNAKDICDRGS